MAKTKDSNAEGGTVAQGGDNAKPPYSPCPAADSNAEVGTVAQGGDNAQPPESPCPAAGRAVALTPAERKELATLEARCKGRVAHYPDHREMARLADLRNRANVPETTDNPKWQRRQTTRPL